MKRDGEDEVEPLEAKAAIQACFELIGGLRKLVAWARSHQQAFYLQLYPKLLPFNVTANVAVTIDDGKEARIELREAFNRVHAARKQEAVVTGSIVVDGVTYHRDTSAAPEVIDVTPMPPAAPRAPPFLTIVGTAAEPAIPAHPKPEPQKPAPASLTPEEARRRAMSPAFPAPLAAQRTFRTGTEGRTSPLVVRRGADIRRDDCSDCHSEAAEG